MTLVFMPHVNPPRVEWIERFGHRPQLRARYPGRSLEARLQDVDNTAWRLLVRSGKLSSRDPEMNGRALVVRLAITWCCGPAFLSAQTPAEVAASRYSVDGM